MVRIEPMLCIAAFVLAAIGVGCAPNETLLKSGRETSRQAEQKAVTQNAFERDLAEVRAADFRFVYVLRRKDGAAFDAEDRKVLRTNTADVNRRVTSDEDRALLIGSNYLLPEANTNALRERFRVEDLSPPEAAANMNK